MQTNEIHNGMRVKYGNQKYIGVITGTAHLPDEVQVQFEGEKNPEYVAPEYLRPVEQGVSA